MRTVAERLAGKAAVVQVNTQANPRLAERFAVTGIPVILLLQAGIVADRLQGARSADGVVAWFEQHQ